MTRPRVFVSSTSAAMRSYRAAAVSALEALSCEVVHQDNFDCDYREVRHLLRDALAPCDAVVLLLGPVYGQEPRDWPQHLQGARRSYTQLEHDLALEWQLPVYRFVASATCPLDPHAAEPQALSKAQQRFVDDIKATDRIWYEFDSRPRLVQLLQRIRFHRQIRHNLPLGSIGNWFKGREEAMLAIRRALLARPAHVAALTARQAIHGLGGVGKSRLALEYAYRFASEYSARLYVRADSAEALHAGLALLAGETVLDLPERHQTDRGQQVRAVLLWLQSHAGWLLVLDNVDAQDAAEAALEVTRPLTMGHTLMTSRLSRWAEDVAMIELDTLTVEASAEFLLARTAPLKETPTARHREVQPDDETQALALAAYLGGLAIALEHAGAYVCQNGSTLADYLALLRQTERSGWAALDPDESSLSNIVALTWKASVDQLGADARTLLCVLSHLAAAPIPVAMIKSGVPEEASDCRIAQPARALRELQDYSLAKSSLDGATAYIHQLVQEVTRQRLSPDQARHYGLASLWMLDRHAEPGGLPNDPRLWHLWSLLAPHVLALADHHDQNLDEAPVVPRLLSDLSVYLRSRGELASAESICRRALALDECRQGPSHVDTAQRLNNLAVIVGTLDRRDEAEALIRRALDIDRAAGSPRVALRLNNLSRLLTQANQIEEAEALIREAIALDEAAGGPDAIDVGRDLDTLCELLLAAQRHAEAEVHARRALAISQNFFGPDHSRVATGLANLAAICMQTGSGSDIEPMLRRALAIDEAMCGPDHPDVARDLNNLGMWLLQTGQREKAAKLLARAVAMNERFFGPKHPRLAQALENQAMAADWPEAEEPLRRAIEIHARSLGAGHPSVARGLCNLAHRMPVDRAAEAQVLALKALHIMEASCAAGDPQIASAIEILLQLRTSTSPHRDLVPLARRLLLNREARLETFGSGGNRIAETALVGACYMLGGLLLSTGDATAAEAVSFKALQVLERHHGREHAELTQVLIFWATALRLQERAKEAEAAYARAVRCLALHLQERGTSHEFELPTVHHYLDLLRTNHGLSETQALARLRDLLASAKDQA